MEKENKFEEIVIKPSSGMAEFRFREYYKFRHLLWSFVWKNVRLQFNEKILGFVWAFARPLTMLAVFALLKRFSKANLYNSIPYSLYFYSGIILWFYFVGAVGSTEQSINRDAGLIKRIYYPRLISPLVSVITGLYTLFLSMIPLLFMMIWEGVFPGWRIVLLPIILLQAMLLCLGVGTIFATLALTKRDYDNFLSLVLYVGLYISPVIYAPDMIPHNAQYLYFLNPAAGMLLAFRSCLFDNFPFPVWQFLYACILSLVFLYFGITMFRRAEMYFADKL